MKTLSELIKELDAAEDMVNKSIERVRVKYPEWLICYHYHYQMRYFSAWRVVDGPECSGSFGVDWEIQSTGQYHRDDLQEIINELKAQEV